MVILLMAINRYCIGGYFKLNYHRLLMAISGTTLLMVISGYYIGGYCWLF